MSLLRFASAAFVAAALAVQVGGVFAGEKHVGENLSQRDFSGKSLDEATFEDCVLQDSSFDRASLIKAVFKGCDLMRANLSNADCTEADFRGATLTFTRAYRANMTKADFEGCDLSKFSPSFTNFTGANLKNLKGLSSVTTGNFTDADLRGANLSGMKLTGDPTTFSKAKYDKKTRWPQGFDVEASGAILTEGDEAPSPTDTAKNLSQEFAKLDANEDGRLSGSEMKGLEAYDADRNGRITFEEFVDGKAKKE